MLEDLENNANMILKISQKTTINKHKNQVHLTLYSFGFIVIPRLLSYFHSHENRSSFLFYLFLRSPLFVTVDLIYSLQLLFWLFCAFLYFLRNSFAPFSRLPLDFSLFASVIRSLYFLILYFCNPIVFFLLYSVIIFILSPSLSVFLFPSATLVQSSLSLRLLKSFLRVFPSIYFLVASFLSNRVKNSKN